MVDLDELIQNAPDNFVIQNALIKCAEVIDSHEKIMCSVSGGADSDVMLDMIIRCGGKEKTTFVFFDTGLEYSATKKHIQHLQERYEIDIVTQKACKSIPTSCKQYGVPFWSKFTSDMMYRLQSHNFQWEDEPFDELLRKYPKCKTALRWWCSERTGETTQFSIDRSPFLKEFIIANKPTFKISDRCCIYAKKMPAHKYEYAGEFDCVCVGIRRSEGGVRANTFVNCFSERDGESDAFRPVFWFTNKDRDEYCTHYDVTHSQCYTVYGLRRTGCFGCPFAKSFEEELKTIEQFEPKLYNAAIKIFGQSYEYTREYYEFREEMKRKLKSNTV